MAESTSTFFEDMTEPMSPEIFSDCEDKEVEPQNMNESMSIDGEEPELIHGSLGWQGTSMNEIFGGLDIFFNEQPPIRRSENHAVLFELTISLRRPPKPFPSQLVDRWSEHFVRMPHSPKCFYTTQNNTDDREVQTRWEVIQQALLQNFISTMHLEAAILSYNNKYVSQWNFTALHSFFEEIDEEETKKFFEKLLPNIINLALQLPSLVTDSIPLLKKHSNQSISLSQLQVASLLANAFLCTFPRRNAVTANSEYASYPYINFNGLFSGNARYPRKLSVKIEKLKCIIHYFRRVTASHPVGTITIERRSVSRNNCPKWDKVKCPLPLLHINSEGTIEDQGAGLLQVDFANKFLGGGVLNSGCVQEEIRFLICPELLVTMLVTEVLDDTEAVIVTGAERYSNYTGYSDTFEWAGDYVDNTPRDSSGRRKTSIVAIDALYFTHEYRQYQGRSIIRELNKAYVGFISSEMPNTQPSGIATGNWGCGAFRGDPYLKSLIQLMAAAVNRRPVVYFTFGDKKLRDDVAKMYWHLIEYQVNVGQLFTLLQSYDSEAKRHQSLYDFLHKRAQVKPILKYFCARSPTSTKPQRNSKKVSPKKYDTNPTIMNKKNICSQKNKSHELTKEEDIRDILEQDQDDNSTEKQNSKYGNKLIDEYFSEEETSKQLGDKLKKETGGNKKSVWSFSAERETQDDRSRIESARKRRISLEEFDKQSGIVFESENELLRNDILTSDSDYEPPEPVDKRKNHTTIREVNRIPESLVNKQTDTGSESTNIINNPQVNKSPSPQKSEKQLNRRKGGQRTIYDFFSKMFLDSRQWYSFRTLFFYKLKK
ncbi:GSCOCG00001669001-RA-CDS [Cotesia congregata]|nr:GSCOCG00001669001-RA-CDS [Cotesia congregata]